MWFLPRSTDHDGTPPAAAMPTPFNFPCGKDFLEFQGDKDRRDKCAPPGWEEYWWSSAGYYSPAICPRGYTAGCFRWNSDQGPAVEASETAVQCVPKGYACVTDDISNAFSDSVSAPMIQVRWAETDLPDFVTHPLYPGVQPTDNSPSPKTAGNELAARQVSSGVSGSSELLPTQTRSSSGRGSQPSGTSGSDDDGRPNFPTFQPSGSNIGPKPLSTGAKAAIGVVIPVVVLLIVGIIGFFWRRHRKNKMNSTAQNQYPPVDPSTQPWAQPQMTSQGGRYEISGGSNEPTMPQPAVIGDEKLEMSADSVYRGSQAFPAELQYQQQSLHQQQSELSGNSPHSPHRNRSELSGETYQYSQPAELSSSPRPVQLPSPTYHTPSPGLPGPTAPPPASMPPAAAVQTQMQTEPSADELMQQNARLEERRQRLLELERIDREQEELQQRIKAQGGN